MIPHASYSNHLRRFIEDYFLSYGVHAVSCLIYGVHYKNETEVHWQKFNCNALAKLDLVHTSPISHSQLLECKQK
jgi:hypothetical protein